MSIPFILALFVCISISNFTSLAHKVLQILYEHKIKMKKLLQNVVYTYNCISIYIILFNIILLYIIFYNIYIYLFIITKLISLCQVRDFINLRMGLFSEDFT